MSGEPFRREKGQPQMQLPLLLLKYFGHKEAFDSG
jgi:hypothetical protein